MLSPQFNLALHDEIVVDNFAGGGGASTGIERAIGRAVDAALNHDPKALAMHRMNHPQTAHYCEDIRAADPVKIAGGRPVGLVWFSPDCKHFSKAKGGKPREHGIRGLMRGFYPFCQSLRIPHSTANRHGNASSNVR